MFLSEKKDYTLSCSVSRISRRLSIITRGSSLKTIPAPKDSKAKRRKEAESSIMQLSY